MRGAQAKDFARLGRGLGPVRDPVKMPTVAVKSLVFRPSRNVRILDVRSTSIGASAGAHRQEAFRTGPRVEGVQRHVP